MRQKRNHVPGAGRHRLEGLADRLLTSYGLRLLKYYLLSIRKLVMLSPEEFRHFIEPKYLIYMNLNVIIRHENRIISSISQILSSGIAVIATHRKIQCAHSIKQKMH
ncbi:hypothetical protein JNB91_16750 [Rhizobium wenxiniae]|uniref:hypothetical protein n=1 Tax=Rhizobium wenxiniae TaxID=1737357 RepID=UPI001C6DEB8F|nr:hypothetical protein [Rhizobium wenxiniae]MBW9089482.1 hypothetical protein [Rhizobium wenxiniae]